MEFYLLYETVNNFKGVPSSGASNKSYVHGKLHMCFWLAPRSMTLKCYKFEFVENFEEFADLRGNNC